MLSTTLAFDHHRITRLGAPSGGYEEIVLLGRARAVPEHAASFAEDVRVKLTTLPRIFTVCRSTWRFPHKSRNRQSVFKRLEPAEINFWRSGHARLRRMTRGQIPPTVGCPGGNFAASGLPPFTVMLLAK